MFKSPITKRPKLTDPSFSQVSYELNAVVILRKNTEELIEYLCSEEAHQLKQRLERIDFQVSKINTLESNVPEMNSIINCFRTLSKEFDESNQSLCDDIVLLKIVEQKKNCSIAKIIDEI